MRKQWTRPPRTSALRASAGWEPSGLLMAAGYVESVAEALSTVVSVQEGAFLVPVGFLQGLGQLQGREGAQRPLRSTTQAASGPCLGDSPDRGCHALGHRWGWRSSPPDPRPSIQPPLFTPVSQGLPRPAPHSQPWESSGEDGDCLTCVMSPPSAWETASMNQEAPTLLRPGLLVGCHGLVSLSVSVCLLWTDGHGSHGTHSTAAPRPPGGQRLSPKGALPTQSPVAWQSRRSLSSYPGRPCPGCGEVPTGQPCMCACVAGLIQLVPHSPLPVGGPHSAGIAFPPAPLPDLAGC